MLAQRLKEVSTVACSSFCARFNKPSSDDQQGHSRRQFIDSDHLYHPHVAGALASVEEQAWGAWLVVRIAKDSTRLKPSSTKTGM